MPYWVVMGLELGSDLSFALQQVIQKEGNEIMVIKHLAQG